MMLSIVVLEFLGTGLVLPFNVVYLHEVRDFSLSQVGLLLGLQPLMGLLVIGPAGVAIDRVGPRRIQLVVLTLLVTGNALLALSHSVALAAVSLAMTGIGLGLSFPAWQSIVASAIPAELRQRYFGVNFTLLNLGIGIGGLVGGVYVDVHRAWTFESIYLADAVSYLPAMVLLLGPLRHIGGRVLLHTESTSSASYLTVFKSPAMASLTLLSFLTSFVGYGQLNSGFPAYARQVGEVSTRGLGIAFACNTAVIVVLQLFVLRRIEGRRRTRVIAVLAAIWALSWLVLGGSGLVSGTLGATVLVAGCASVFALGETLLQPTIPALVNDLAPDHLRGRYNALSSAAFQGAAVIAPPFSGFLVGHALGNLYIGLLVAGCALVALVAVGRLEPQLTATVNGVREEEPAHA
jgi:MFS family permease